MAPSRQFQERSEELRGKSAGHGPARCGGSRGAPGFRGEQLAAPSPPDPRKIRRSTFLKCRALPSTLWQEQGCALVPWRAADGSISASSKKDQKSYEEKCRALPSTLWQEQKRVWLDKLPGSSKLHCGRSRSAPGFPWRAARGSISATIRESACCSRSMASVLEQEQFCRNMLGFCDFLLCAVGEMPESSGRLPAKAPQ